MAVIIEKSLRDSLLRDLGYPVIPIPEDKHLQKNLIVYGAPGTGKSNHLEELIEDYFSDSRLYTRVTFHPNYSYTQFVGSYKPVPIYKKNTTNEIYKQNLTSKFTFEPLIDYQFVPGPFIEMLCKAIMFPKSNFLLLIEEINRANVASVFGDVFQLLDREKGESKYPITFNSDIMNYLESQPEVINKLENKDKIKIPSNLYIWATMNSSDQGVLPMDAAFKRRWSFKYMPLNENEKITESWELVLKFHNKPIKWNKLRKAINQRLKGFVPEDKLLGPFFLKNSELPSSSSDKEEHDIFINKLILYLKEDVLRHSGSDEIFKYTLLSDIIEKYNSGTENIFKFSVEELESENIAQTEADSEDKQEEVSSDSSQEDEIKELEEDEQK